MVDLDIVQWLLASLCAFIIGFTKTGIPGLGILATLLMTEVVSAHTSIGVILPMLMFGDILSVGYYRRRIVWSHILRFMPCTALGIIIGYLALGRIDDQQLRRLISVITLVLLGIDFWRKNLREGEVSVPTQWWFVAGMGLVAGITTMMANAAGAIVVIYLLSMRLPKGEFIGTSAWYYLIINWFKVPFNLNLGLITTDSLRFDFVLYPIIAVGAVCGIVVLKYIPENKFAYIMRILAAASAIKLLF